MRPGQEPPGRGSAGPVPEPPALRRPCLKPGLRTAWRETDVLQVGLEAGHGIVLAGVTRAAGRLVDALDGTRDLGALLAEAATAGLDPARAQDLLDQLAGAGLLDDAASEPLALRGRTGAERARLRPELAAAALVHGDRDGGHGVLDRRRAARVVVVGAGRVGAGIATLLAAAGIGHLDVDDRARVRAEDVAPLGVPVGSEGRPRADAVRDRLTATTPSLRPVPRRGAGGEPRGPALTVLAPDSGRDPARLGDLLRRGIAHLVVEVRETSTVVGPLVLPGATSCARCHDLHRADRDPAWPRVAAQLAAPRRRDPGCDVLLATATAALAAAQAVAFVDGLPPDVVDGTLETTLPGLRVRRRSWTQHPACGCSWPATG